MLNRPKGLKELFKEVIDQGLCTGCGACITGCPYLAVYRGRIVKMEKCSMETGDCYNHCPRTRTNMNALSERIFGIPYSCEEVGHALDIFMARSTDKEIMGRTQDGGTVTTLLVVG